MSLLGPSYQQQDYYNQQQLDWRTSQQVVTRINRPPPPLTLSRGNSAPDLPTRSPNGKFINPSAALPVAPLPGGPSSYDMKPSYVDPSLDFNYINVSLSNMSLSQGSSPTAMVLDMNNHKQPLDIDTRTTTIEDIFSTSPSKRMSAMAMLPQQHSPPQHSGSWLGPSSSSGKKTVVPAAVGGANSKRSALDIEKEINGQNLYKTELCRSFVETGACRYGSKCQFAHGRKELRPVLRHPKYKTEICKTFHTIGTCPYGTRCRFIHKRPDAEIGDNSIILPVPPVQPGIPPASIAAVSNPEWSIWKDGLSDVGVPSDGLAPQQQHLLTMNGLNGMNGGISLMKAFPGNGLSSSHDRILLGQHAVNGLAEDPVHGENGQHRGAVSAIDRRRSHEGKKKSHSHGSGSGGSSNGSGANGANGREKDKRKSKSTRSRTKSSPSGRKKNHRRRKSTGDGDDDDGAARDVDHDVGGASVGINLEIPPIVDAGPDTEEDADEPLPVAPVSPKKPVAAAPHRPRTLSAKERLPIFQVLCTDADEEIADVAEPAPTAQKVVSSSS